MVPNQNESSRVWRALAHPTRREIVNLLQERPRTTGELCHFFEVSRYAVMKHLTVLEQAGLVQVQREGRQRWNILNQDEFEQFSEQLAGEPDGDEPVSPFPATPRIGVAGALRIQREARLAATPGAVFRALTGDIDRWWQPRTLAGSRIVLEPRVDGRFYELFDDEGAGELYAVVVYVRRNAELRLRGPLGIVDEAAISNVRLVLEEDGDATVVTLSHHVAGEVDAAMHDAFDEHWRVLLEEQLAAYLAGQASAEREPAYDGRDHAQISAKGGDSEW